MNELEKRNNIESQRTWQTLQNPVTALNSDIPNSLKRVVERLEKQNLHAWDNIQYVGITPACLERFRKTPKCENNTLEKFNEIFRINRINIFEIPKYEENNILSRLRS